MAILDDLKGILSPEDFAKLSGNAALKTKLEKGEELYGYYVGEDVTPPANTVVVEPPARTTPPSLDLSGIERVLDARLSKLDERIDSRLETVVASKGTELVNNAVKIALQRSDELNRLYRRAENLTGKEFDSADFNTFLEKPENQGKFQSIEQAGNAYLDPIVRQKEIDKGIEAGIAAKSGSNVPGTTPAPGTNKTILHFRSRTTAAEGGQMTGAQRAAALLDRRAAEAS